MQEIFSNTTLTVNQLIEKIDTGELGLPELQRPFIWKDSKVRDLFDSMMEPRSRCLASRRKEPVLYSSCKIDAQSNTGSKHSCIDVSGLLTCSCVGCSVSVALLRFPRLLLAASQNPSPLWMH